MTETTIDRAQLRNFVSDVFGHLPRSDQRRWAYAYLAALLDTPGKKTIQRMARTLGSGPAFYRGLNQFVNASPWEWDPARSMLSRIAMATAPASAWTTAALVVPKRGEHVVGAQPRFVPAQGRLVNCQLAYGLFLVSGRGCISIDWNLALGESWLLDDSRRARARIPDSAGTGDRAAHPLAFSQIVDDRRPHGNAPLIVGSQDDADPGALPALLARRGGPFVVQIRPDQILLLSPPQRLGPPAAEAHPHTACALAARGGRRRSYGYRDVGPRQRQPVTVTQQSPVWLPPAHGEPRRPCGPLLLLAESGTGAGPTRYWVTNLLDRPIGELLALVGHSDAAKNTVTDLVEVFGAGDFGGRSYPGWHRHMTLVSAAHTFAVISGIAAE